jgi:hypothetical protein
MPKQRPPFDHERYTALKAQGLSQRAIAEQMGMPEATLRNNLKVMAQAMAEAQAGEGPPVGDQGGPCRKNAEVHPGSPKGDHRGIHQGDDGTPPLYVHPGIPDDGEESPVGGEDIAEVHQGIPAIPLTGVYEGDQGGPRETLSPELVEALTSAWPDLLPMLNWWRAQQQHAQEPAEKLERITYHVAPKWIEAVRREADMSGESYAAVVNRAFAQYFARRST